MQMSLRLGLCNLAPRLHVQCILGLHIDLIFILNTIAYVGHTYSKMYM